MINWLHSKHSAALVGLLAAFGLVVVLVAASCTSSAEPADEPTADAPDTSVVSDVPLDEPGGSGTTEPAGDTPTDDEPGGENPPPPADPTTTTMPSVTSTTTPSGTTTLPPASTTSTTSTTTTTTTTTTTPTPTTTTTTNPPNHPPTATITSPGHGSIWVAKFNGINFTASVPLMGTGTDPDGDPLTYRWSWSGGSAFGQSATAKLAPGTYTITLTVRDSSGGTDGDSTSILVWIPSDD